MRSIGVSARGGFRWCILHVPKDDTPKAEDARNVTGCLGSGNGTFDRLTLLVRELVPRARLRRYEGVFTRSRSLSASISILACSAMCCQSLWDVVMGEPLFTAQQATLDSKPSLSNRAQLEP